MTTVARVLNSRQSIALLVVAAAAAILPTLTGSFILYIATYVIAMAVAALGYNIAYGLTGIISVGHSIMFGYAAYTMGILSRSLAVTSNGLLIFLAVLAVGFVLGIVVGFFASFVRGIYVVLVTLVCAEIAFLIIWSNPWGLTWGESGIIGIRPGTIIGEAGASLFRGVGLYYLGLVLLALVLVAVKVLRNSQLGLLFQGIRDNEQRIRSLGFNVRSYKVLAFGLSGAVTAIGGYIVGALDNSASAGLVEWQLGAELLVICLLGGARSIWGPVIGAVVVVTIDQMVRSYTAGNVAVYALGAVYVVVMLWMRGGITGSRPVKRLSAWGCEKLWARSKREADG